MAEAICEWDWEVMRMRDVRMMMMPSTGGERRVRKSSGRDVR